jgi:hypothetical protein
MILWRRKKFDDVMEKKKNQKKDSRKQNEV